MTTTIRKATSTRAILATMLLCLLLGGCGSDGFVVIAINTGIIVSSGACGGEFNMRNDSGLLLVVIIGDSTAILLPNGLPGTCASIQSGAHASVRGPTKNGQVTANQIQLQ